MDRQGIFSSIWCLFIRVSHEIFGLEDFVSNVSSICYHSGQHPRSMHFRENEIKLGPSQPTLGFFFIHDLNFVLFTTLLYSDVDMVTSTGRHQLLVSLSWPRPRLLRLASPVDSFIVAAFILMLCGGGAVQDRGIVAEATR